ncbi:MAG: hypothetical protein IJU56_01300 [Clostridia bacterium]|nr:hypothetical protein [Clostridia bacterium]
MAVFVTLSCVPQPRTRKRRKKAQSKIFLERVALPGAFSFYRMTAEFDSDRLPWEDIARAAGSLRRRFLLPPSLSPPKSSSIGVFSPQVLPQFLLFHFAVRVLREKNLAPQSTAITLTDPQAVLTQHIRRLAPFAKALRVLTVRPAQYEAAQHALLAQTGMALCVAPLTAPKPQSGVAITLSAAALPRDFSGLVITTERRLFLHAETVCGADVTLPKEIEQLRPSGIDRVQFASALEECCKMKSLRELGFCTVRQSGTDAAGKHT